MCVRACVIVCECTTLLIPRLLTQDKTGSSIAFDDIYSEFYSTIGLLITNSRYCYCTCYRCLDIIKKDIFTSNIPHSCKRIEYSKELSQLAERNFNSFRPTFLIVFSLRYIH